MLGCPLEASRELEHLDAALQAHPSVLDLRWHIYRDAGRWDACFETAHAMTEAVPEDPQGWLLLAQTFYFTYRFQEALDLIVSKIPVFPTHWTLYYDAACYACRLAKLAHAQEFLDVAIGFGHGNEVRRKALADVDLQALWSKLAPPGAPKRTSALTRASKKVSRRKNQR